MTKIEYLVNRSGYYLADIYICQLDGCCNGFGPRGINLLKPLRLLPNFKKDKEKKLLDDIDILACIHDIEFGKGGNIFDFVKANYKLARNIYDLLSWNYLIIRLVISIIIFITTTIGGFIFFKWKLWN